METTATLTIHSLTLGGIIAILGILAYQHKIYIRVIDRLDQVWADYCDNHKIKYTQIKNGSK